MKLALCIPCYGDTKAKFTQSLAAMIAHTCGADLRDAQGDKIPVQVETFMVSSSMLTESRHRLVAEAMSWGADYMLWLDADHVFPHDTFCRLWSHGKAIVGVNYPRRSTPTAPTAAYDDGSEHNKLLYTTQDKAEAGLVEECSHMGFGVCLMNMAVFDVLQDHCDATGAEFLPLFLFEPTADKVGMVGEDVYFFRKLRAAGLSPFIDHGLSWAIGHLSEVILTNAHALLQKDKWAEFRKSRADKFAVRAQEIEQAAAAEIVA